MQLVSRKILEQLATHVNEDDSQYLHIMKMFKECEQVYAKILNDARDDDDAKGKDKFSYSYQRLYKTYLKPNKKMFKFVGRGSSRIVFAMNDGYCLKIATELRGIEQNRQEAMNSQSEYECFPKIYASNETYGMILVECCCQMYQSSTFSDVKRFYGVDHIQHVIAALDDIVNVCNCNIDSAINLLKKSAKNGRYCSIDVRDEYPNVNYRIRLDVCQKIRDNKIPAFKILNNIVKFYNDHGNDDHEMMLVDLEYDKNWGLAVRDKVLVPIIIDSGLSQEIADEYYSY